MAIANVRQQLSAKEVIEQIEKTDRVFVLLRFDTGLTIYTKADKPFLLHQLELVNEVDEGQKMSCIIQHNKLYIG